MPKKKRIAMSQRKKYSGRAYRNKRPVTFDRVQVYCDYDHQDTDQMTSDHDEKPSLPSVNVYHDHDYLKSDQEMEQLTTCSDNEKVDTCIPDLSLNHDHDYVWSINPDYVKSDENIDQDHQAEYTVIYQPSLETCTNIPSTCQDNSTAYFLYMKQEIKGTLPSPYVFVNTENDIEIIDLYKVDGKTSIKLTINVNCDFTAKIHVHRRELPHDHHLWTDLPMHFDSTAKVFELLTRLQKYAVCIGNPDEEFQELAPIDSQLSDNKMSSLHAYREGDFCACIGSTTYHSTIRSVDCALLVDGRRCCKCAEYRRSLWKRKYRLDKKSKFLEKDLVHSQYKHKDMDRNMLITKIKQQQSFIKTLEHKVEQQKHHIDKHILQTGSSVPEHQKHMEKAFPDPNSLQRLFWEQQLKFSKSGKNGMRWHPMIIRWCLFLRHKSATTYDIFRNSGFVNLPSSRTLFDYSHHNKNVSEFQGDFIKMLKEFEEATKKGQCSDDDN